MKRKINVKGERFLPEEKPPENVVKNKTDSPTILAITLPDADIEELGRRALNDILAGNSLLRATVRTDPTYNSVRSMGRFDPPDASESNVGSGGPYADRPRYLEGGLVPSANASQENITARERAMENARVRNSWYLKVMSVSRLPGRDNYRENYINFDISGFVFNTETGAHRPMTGVRISVTNEFMEDRVRDDPRLLHQILAREISLYLGVSIARYFFPDTIL